MKKFYLLDTTVISEIRKPSPHQNVVLKFMKNKNFSDISAITWAESLTGLKGMPEGKKKELFPHSTTKSSTNNLK